MSRKSADAVQCPRAELHTPQPTGYLAWHDWAGRMTSQGARQSKCSGCGLYAIWSKPRKPVTW